MAKEVQHITIDIGTLHIKVVSLVDSRGKKIVKKLIMEDTPSLKEDELVDKVKDMLRRSFTKQELSNALISLVLSYPFVEIKRLELPSIPNDEIRDAVMWEAKEKTAIDIDKSYFDFIITDELVDEYESKKLIIMVAISPKKIVDKLAGLSMELDLEIEGISAAPFCVSNILNRLTPSNKEKTVSVVEIGYEHTSIALYKKGKLTFIRILPVASNQMTKAIAGVFTMATGEKIELSKERAEALKEKYGIPFGEKDKLLEDSVSAGQMLAKMRPVLESLSMEIKRSFDYYVSEFEDSRPEKIFLTGGGAHLANLDVFLKDEVGINVENLRLPDRVKTEGNQDTAFFLGAIAVSMGDMEVGPNLLPLEFRRHKLQKIQKISIRMVAFVAFSVLFFLYMILHLEELDYKKRLVNAQSHRAIIQDVLDTYNSFTSRLELSKKLIEGSLPYMDIFKELSNIIPADIMLEKLSIDEDKRTMEMEGLLFLKETSPEEMLAAFMQNLERSSYFEEANLKSVKKTEGKKKNIAIFKIQCVLN